MRASQSHGNGQAKTCRKKRMKLKHMKNRFILKSISIARNAAGVALGAPLIAAAVVGGLLVYGTPVERMIPSALAAETAKIEKPSHVPERLYGTWTAKDVDAKLGEVEIRLSFLRAETASLMAWSDVPFVGQVRDLKGPFSVYGDTISSKAIRDGEKATFSFVNDQLVLRFKSGKVVRFNRE